MEETKKQTNQETMKQSVLITGGAGSLGKAFVNLLKDKYEVYVIDHNEWGIAELSGVQTILADFASWRYDELPVDYLLHLAAYKHVNLGETNPSSFIANNIYKTEQLFKEAAKYNVETMYMSTDKAVEPVSLYGYTKAIGEKLAQSYGFSVARMGNILNSSGSVIPIWERAIANQEPIPITDERMVRYFIEDYDAANQIWHEFIQNKKLIIPKCQKIRLLDLLGEVLRRKGYQQASEYSPGVYVIGMRPGEKLDERLLWPEEDNAGA